MRTPESDDWCEPHVTANPEDSKADVARKLRAEARRREDIARTMRYGKTRACEFAYLRGLDAAAELLEGRSLYLACPTPANVVHDGHTVPAEDVAQRDADFWAAARRSAERVEGLPAWTQAGIAVTKEHFEG